MSTDPDDQAPRSSYWGIALLPLVYTLSIGPVAWLLDHFHVPQDSWPFGRMVLFYMPLEWLADRLPLFRDLLNWYLSLLGLR
ncbi:MAG: hypothetical protein AB7I48_18600 [Planctomycetaceae bacterium]